MKAHGLLAVVVLGGSIVLGAAVFAIVSELLGSAGDAGSREIIARLEEDVAEREDKLLRLRNEVKALKNELAALKHVADRAVAIDVEPEDAPPILDQYGGVAQSSEAEGLTDRMELAPDRFNKGVKRLRPAVLRELLGEPRESYTQDCLPVTNPRLLQALETRQISTFKLTMLRPALDSLERLLERLRREEPELYAAIGTAGALCARYIRGSSRSVSSHAWGTAVDLTLRGKLDRLGDASTQFGLVVLAEFFNDEGWFWGASYGREDSMHFEVSENLLRQWLVEGRL